MTGLNTDLYQLTMAAGYHDAGIAEQSATFELFFRRLPRYRNFVLAAGLAQVVEYLRNLRFTDDEIVYLRSLPQFANVSGKFFDVLREFQFTGDLFAMPEGTPIFAGEPFLTVRAPLIQAQMVEVAGGRAVVEFGTRRAHSPEAGVLAGRAAYIGGCIGTSNTETGYRFGIPVFGTCAHSWVMSFEHERESFVQLQKLLGESTAYLIDTYDTLEAARR